ncbi:hypothetical protein CNMCM5623_000250 [Aspergillus felis]|uniref:Mid2 domain-containing protein n=1 Tax=Aspergillus felis TaxID=1287682 RepID=A0A8H6QNW9_9EURO|nr:hypothetical protein CNMCM5623_000250 [Aspergillus felis]KAF7176394.1 hypothetical protein CNMCM7691_002523 [Aspergillus felis]
MSISTLLLALALNVFQSNAFEVTYPKKDDLVNVYNGLVTTWSYNSSDSILLPLTIYFVPVSHLDESATYIQDNINITLGRWTIFTSFPVAEAYYLRFIYANNFWETGNFMITTSEQSTNASDTSSSASPNLYSTSHRSSTTLWTTESTGTGTSSLAQETNRTATVASSLTPGTIQALGSGGAATAATNLVSSSNENYDNGLSTGAKAGIGIGCAAAAIIGIVGLLLLYRIKQKGKFPPPEPPNLPSVNSTKLNGCSDARKIFEADGKHEAANISELPSDPYTRSELPG